MTTSPPQKRENCQCLAPANNCCSGGILFFLLSWAIFAILIAIVLGLENKLFECKRPCYSPTFCWESSLTPPSMCVGDATKCFNKCMPEMVGNLTNDGSSGCQQANKCNEIYLEENEKINQCISVCTLENKVLKVSPITFPLGLLLLVLMGTISLNFYQESVGCPLKCTRPWYREVPGRVLVYGSMSLATVLVILIISLLGGPALALNEQASMGFAIMMVFVLIFVFNIGLIATSLIGRCCIAQDTTVAEASSESDEGAASSSSPSSTIVVVGAAN